MSYTKIMGKIATVARKKTDSKLPTEKRSAPPFINKIPFIRSLIIDSIEPGIIKKIYIFGSYAYGKPTKKSDIDLCVVIENNQDDSNTYLKIARSLFINNIIPADILLYKENDFINLSKKNGIENIIFTSGKLIYG